MKPAGYTSRWAVAATVVASLSLPGLFPQGVVRAEGSSKAVTAPPSAACCCGSNDGSCCGMACCVAHSAPEKESPSQKPHDTREGRQPLALPAALLHSANGYGIGRLPHPMSSATRSLVTATLQAQHVRIDA